MLAARSLVVGILWGSVAPAAGADAVGASCANEEAVSLLQVPKATKKVTRTTIRIAEAEERAATVSNMAREAAVVVGASDAVTARGGTSGSARESMPAEAVKQQDFLTTYFAKFRGAGVAAPPRAPPKQSLYSFLGAFSGIATLGLLDMFVVKRYINPAWALLTPPFGAMAVLVFSACTAPLSQPFNVVAGNTIGGVVGVAVCEAAERLLGKSATEYLWLSAALAVSLTIVVQERAGCVHPPGGASALVYVIVQPMRAMGMLYPIIPCLVGAVWFVLVAMVTNNLSSARAYPQASWSFLPMDKDGATEGGSWLAAYLAKFAGAGMSPPPKSPVSQSGFSFLGSFCGIAALGLLPRVLTKAIPGFPSQPLLIGAFGAMAVLVDSAADAPLAQPRNVILGNGIGALVGVIVFKLFQLLGQEVAPRLLWLRAALAVSLTIVAQELTGTVHPPGGATAMIFLIMVPFQQLGLLYVLMPAMLGSVVYVVVAMLTNNLSAARAYPQGWW